MFEKRKHVRMKDDLGIAVSGDAVPSSGKNLFLTKNISEGGLQFQHAGEMPVGSKLRIRIAMKDPLKTITHVGCVRWTDTAAQDQRRSVGIEFVESPNGDMWHWLQYVDQITPA